MEHPALFKVVAGARSDAAYKAKLLSDPAAALAKMGRGPPEGAELEVRENTARKMHQILPAAPPNHELGESAGAASGTFLRAERRPRMGQAIGLG